MTAAQPFASGEPCPIHPARTRAGSSRSRASSSTRECTYGPLFTLLSYPLAPLGVATGTWVVKCTIAAAALGSLALVWRLAQALDCPPVAAVLFVGLNPLWLVFEVGWRAQRRARPSARARRCAARPAPAGGPRGSRRGGGRGGEGECGSGAPVRLARGRPPLALRRRRPRRLVAVLLGCLVAFGADAGRALDSFTGQAKLTSLRSVPGLDLGLDPQARVDSPPARGDLPRRVRGAGRRAVRARGARRPLGVKPRLGDAGPPCSRSAG